MEIKINIPVLKILAITISGILGYITGMIVYK